MHTSSSSINLRPATLTRRLPFLTLILTSHPRQNQWALCGLLVPKDHLPLTYYTTGKGNQIETGAGENYFDFARVILKDLIKVLISSKCVQPVQQTSRFHLIKNAFMFGSLWFYLPPLSHPFHIRKGIAEGVQAPLNIPTTTRKKKLRQKKSVQHSRERRENTLPHSKSSKLPRKQHTG